MSYDEIFLSSAKTEEIFKTDIRRMHFVGILGAGMLPLARLAMSLGYEISGSDGRATEQTVCNGVRVSPHAHGLLNRIDLLVVSFAIPTDSPEITDARALCIPIISRAQLLGALMIRYDRRIGICGSHGKSTTTALLDSMLCIGGVSHITVPGATLFDGSDVRIAEADTIVYEACEYRDAFLSFHPTLQIITSIDLDHADYFADIDAVRHSFALAANMAVDGVILNTDFDGSADFATMLGVPVITYGRSEIAVYRYVISAKTKDSYSFCIYKRGEMLLRAKTALIGEYNIANITAAVAAADILGVNADDITQAISIFSGIERRMSHIGRLRQSAIFYDYAHHPTEITLAIEALKERYGECAVVFKPHTYSRTKALWNEFIAALSKSNFTILLDIYPAREKPLAGITSRNLALAMDEKACFADDAGALDLILDGGYPAVVLMGAGDMDALIDMIKAHKEFLHRKEE